MPYSAGLPQSDVRLDEPSHILGFFECPDREDEGPAVRVALACALQLGLVVDGPEQGSAARGTTVTLSGRMR